MCYESDSLVYTQKLLIATKSYTHLSGVLDLTPKAIYHCISPGQSHIAQSGGGAILASNPVRFRLENHSIFDPKSARNRHEIWPADRSVTTPKLA